MNSKPRRFPLRFACALAVLSIARAAAAAPLPASLANSSMQGIWFARDTDDHSLAPLPPRLETASGVVLEVADGAAGPNAVMLAGHGSPADVTRVNGIPVGKRCEVLWFLHCYNPGPALRAWQQENRDGKDAGDAPLEPPVLFRYVIHYEDGRELPVGVRWGESINDWLRAGEWADPPYAETVWREQVSDRWVLDRWPRAGLHLAVYAMRFENPRPGVVVESIDIVSANDSEHDWGAPALLAVGAGDREYPGTTHYITPAGDDDGPGTFERPWASIYKAAEVLEAGDTVYVRGGRYMFRQDWQQVAVVANSGTEDAPITLAAYPGETAILDGNEHHCAHDTRVPYAIYDRDRGMFNIFERDNIVVRGLWFVNSRKAGIGVYQCRNILLDHNVVYGTYMPAMNTASNKDFRIIGNTLGKNCSVYYRYDHETQEWEPWSPEMGRIRVGGREAIDNHRNEDTEIAFNEIYWCNKEGIADPGRHVRIHHNHIHHLEHTPLLYWPSGIYVDAYGPIMDDIEVYDNVIHNAAGGISIGSEGGTLATDIRVHNNLIFDMTWEGIGINAAGADGPRENIVIENNTILRCGHTPWEDGPTGGIVVGTTNVRDLTIRRNILVDHRDYNVSVHGDIDMVRQEVRVCDNLYDPVFPPTERIEKRLPRWRPVISDGLVWGDPLFTDADAWDFTLRPDSPAVDVLAGTQDRDGTAGDLGAFPRVQTLPPPPPAGKGLVLRVNCGAEQDWTDAEGRTWQADRRLPDSPEPGDWGCSWSRTVTRDPRPIAGTDIPDVYLAERYGMERYTFLPAPGRYTVRLHFAETWHTEPGQRAFSVLLNGRTVLEGFDPLAEAGAANAAVVREFEVPVFGKGLTVEFRAETDSAMINGIEVIQVTE